MTTTQPPSPRAGELADQYLQATADLLGVVEPGSPAIWQTRCANEERTVGVLVHHLATITDTAMDAAQHIIAGDPPPQLTQALIDHVNARHAELYANVGQAETVVLLRERSAATGRFIRGLTEANLVAASHQALFGPEPISAEQLLSYMLVGHTLGHLGSIRAALGE